MGNPGMYIETFASILPELEYVDLPRREAAMLAVRFEDGRWTEPGSLATFDRRPIEEGRLGEIFRRAERRAVKFVRATFRQYEQVEVCYEAGDVPGAIEALHGLADLYRRRGHEAGRRRVLEKALELAGTLPDRGPQLSTLRLLGDLDTGAGNFDRARFFYLQSARLAKGLDLPRDVASALLGLGRVALQREQFREAESHLFGALHVAREAAEEVLLARLYEALAELHGYLGRMGRALQWSGRAADVWQKLGDTRNLGACFDLQGTILLRGREPGRARARLRRALRLTRDPQVRASAHRHLGKAELEERHLLLAEEKARRCEEIALASFQDLILVDAYRLLGEVARARGEASGIVFFESALRICRGRYPHAAGRVLLDYAAFREGFGEGDQAVACLRLAREQFLAAGAPRWIRRVERGLEELGAPKRHGGASGPVGDEEAPGAGNGGGPGPAGRTDGGPWRETGH